MTEQMTEWTTEPTTGPTTKPTSQYPVCTLAELPEGSHVVRQLTERLSVGVYHVDGQIVAFRNHCPHNGAPVCEGTVGSAIVSDDNFQRCLKYEGRILRCPWHAWEFLLPEGETLTKPVFRLLRHPVVIEAGQIFVGSSTNAVVAPVTVPKATA